MCNNYRSVVSAAPNLSIQYQETIDGDPYSRYGVLHCERYKHAVPTHSVGHMPLEAYLGWYLL